MTMLVGAIRLAQTDLLDDAEMLRSPSNATTSRYHCSPLTERLRTSRLKDVYKTSGT